MLIFLDVGAHEGQTLEEVTKPSYSFDRIIAFEPMPAQYAHLVARFGAMSAVELLNYGLADATSARPIYGTNDQMEASIYAAKNDVDATVVTWCQILEASEFFRRHITGDDTVIVKLNCEGAEVPILNNLIDTGEIHKIANVMVDFDIRKVVGREVEEEALLARFREVEFTRFVLCEDVMVGPTHQDRIANWLRRCP